MFILNMEVAKTILFSALLCACVTSVKMDENRKLNHVKTYQRKRSVGKWHDLINGNKYNHDQNYKERYAYLSTREVCEDNPSIKCSIYKPYCSRTRVRMYCKKTCNQCPPTMGISTTGQQAVRTCGKAVLRSNKISGAPANIVGGSDSVKGYYPWQVAIYYDGQFLCGGSLFDKNHVLTAAHCFNGIADDVKSISVVLGDYNRGYDEGTEQELDVTKLTIHDKYNMQTTENDIAIIKLSAAAKLTYYIETICLPEEGEERKPGSMCFLSGWGKPYVNGRAMTILQELEVPTVGRETCNKRNQGAGREVTAKMICTGYDDGIHYSSGCHGDSGGPLACNADGVWKLFGVVSWGSSQCNGLDRYTVFTKVSAYIPWIKKHTA